MTVRKAELADMEAVVRMGVRFSEETGYAGLVKVNPVRVAVLTADLLSSENAVVLISENGHGPEGMIAMLAYDHPFSGERTAFEVVWWVEPEARGVGLKLLRAAEAWAREQGAKTMQMVAPEGTRVGALYERLKYSPVEHSYQRRL